MMKGKIKTLIFFIILAAVFADTVYSQTKTLKITGKVYSEVTSKPVEFATIAVLETRKKFYTEEEGQYQIELPGPGTYTFLISVEGLKTLEEKIDVKSDMTHDFTVTALKVTGRSLTVRSTRDLQKVSRYTMTSEEIKEVPAGFGDIVRGLTSLPGITSQSLFNSIIMRGADPDGNYYTIDNIPILDPRHFLGLHTIISSDAVGEIDVFSSAAPAEYGFLNAAVISMNTIDEVKKLGGMANIGLISANAIVKGPIESVQSNGEKENRGYWFVAGRGGYLSLLFPLFNDVLDAPISSLPEYYDYQAKVKFYFNSANAIRVLLIGTGDVFIVNTDPAAQDQIAEQTSGGDPLNPFTGADVNYEQYSHNQAIYYDFKPNTSFSNTLMLFTSFSKQDYIMQMQYANSTADLSRHTKPNIYGVRDDLSLKWINNETVLKFGIGFRYFDFSSSGINVVSLQPWVPGTGGSGPPDFSDPDQYSLEPYNRSAENMVFGGYLENKFKFGGFIFTPGVRIDYLELNQETEVDPRGLLSYEFKTGTILSLAGGKYSQFMQTNPNYFDMEPLIAVTPDYVAEKAIHSVFGVEQKIKDYSGKVEVFYNWFYDISYQYSGPDNLDSNGDQLNRIQSGVGKNYGVEVILKKIGSEDKQGLYGWISYAYTQAKLKTGVPNETFSDTFINSHREEAHSVKAIAGYRFGQHTISTKVALSSSFPYTGIVGDDGDPYGIGRYAPVYADTPNTHWYDPAFTIDLRYSFKKSYKWGELSFYIELLNVLGAVYQRRDNLQWDYSLPYESGVNPVLSSSDQILPVIPNFGVEVKF